MLKGIDPLLSPELLKPLAYALMQTGGLQAWANFLFRQGMITEALRP